MKLVGIGGLVTVVASLCVSGCGVTPDYEHTVKQPGEVAFAAMSSAFQELQLERIYGINPEPISDKGSTVSFAYEEKKNEELKLSVLYDQRPAMDLTMRFSPIDTAQTKLATEIDFHATPITPGGALPPEQRAALGKVLDKIVGEIDAGRPVHIMSSIKTTES